jgi:hypothetical protein
MKKESYGRNQVVGEVFYLESIGRDFVKSAELLLEENNKKKRNGEYFNSIMLLASQAVELLPKSLIAVDICLKRNNESLEEIRSAVNRKLSCLCHNIDDIFSEVTELKRALKITGIKRVNNKNNANIFIDEFRIKIGAPKEQKQIRIKNLEGARYGMFAKNKDIGGYSSKDIENVVDFLKKLGEETNKLRANMITKFDKKLKK